VEKLAAGLVAKRDECKGMLEKQVFGNYNHFIDSTHNMRSLESDITALRQLFSEQHRTLDALESSVQTGPSVGLRNLKGKVKKSATPVDQVQVHEKLSLFDSLDSLIAERRFRQAVDIVESEGKVLEGAERNVRKQMERRVLLLAEQLCHEIENPSCKQNECRRVILYLIRIGKLSLARDTFLRVRSQSIQNAIK
jgi:hypothetical protein